MSAFSAWCVTATPVAFEARELTYSQLSAPFVLAIHGSRHGAEQGANAATLMRELAEEKYAEALAREVKVRGEAEPGSAAWASSVDHEIAIRNRIAAAVIEAAQPRKRAASATAK